MLLSCISFIKTAAKLLEEREGFEQATRTPARDAGSYSGQGVQFVSKRNTAVKRNAHVRDLRKRGKNKGKLYTKECGLNKNTKYKKTPENIR